MHCITRLRVEVLNKSEVNKDELKSLGASWLLEVGNNIQAIFGPKSDQIKHDMARIIQVKLRNLMKQLLLKKAIKKVLLF